MRANDDDGAGGQRPARILILYAQVGEGHAAAARTLRSDLAEEAPAVEVICCDLLEHFGWLLRVILCDWYRWLLRFAPWLYGLIYWIKANVAPARRLDGLLLTLLGGRTLLATVRAHAPDAIVSTYPAATRMLGHLRRWGYVEVPVYATITDFAGLAYCAHPCVDLHLVAHEWCIAPIERVAGEGAARRVRPLVAPAYFDRPSRGQARLRLGLAGEDKLVVVTGGGWGVGDLRGAVRTALTISALRVVVVTGRNERRRSELERMFAGEARVTVLGFTDRMLDLLAGADALVHASGGVTCLEALACGCPVVAYGSPPGHARANDAIMASLGLVDHARSPHQLQAALKRVLAQTKGPTPGLAAAPTASSFVLTAKQRPVALARRRRPAWTAALIASAALLLGGWTFTSEEAYSVVARVLDLPELRTVRTNAPRVALVVRAPSALVPILAAELRKYQAHASFALAQAPNGRAQQLLDAAGNDTLPELAAAGPLQFLAAPDRLRREARALHLGHHFYYLAPRAGLTIAQYLLVRSEGGLPVVGARWFAHADIRRHTFRRGEILVLALGKNASADRRELAWLTVLLAREHLASVSLTELLALKGAIIRVPSQTAGR